MTDFIVGAILVALVAAAIAYIIKEKKRGVRCIGCPAAGTCGSKNNPDGAGCSCSIMAEEDVESIMESIRSGQDERK